jgi:hypothetical protein
MSLTWGSMQVTEDEHGDIHAVAIPEMCEAMVEAGEAHEAQIAEIRRVEVCMDSAFLIAAAVYAAGAVAVIWLAVHFIPWGAIWENCLWFWNSGPEDSPWMGPARWGVVTGLVCVVWCCLVGFYEWWTKDRS